MPAMTAFALVGALVGLWVPLFSSAELIPLYLIFGSFVAWWFAGPALLCGLLLTALTSLHCHWYLQQTVASAIVKKDVVVSGVVERFPRTSRDSTTFMFRVESGALRGRYRLRIYGQDPAVAAGQAWRLKVRLKRPIATANRGAFNQELWYLWNRVHGTGYVRSSRLNSPIAEPAFAEPALAWRAAIRDRIKTVSLDSRVKSLIYGIVIGARDEITKETWWLLRATGTAHLMAISGMHIGLVAVFAWFPGRLVGWMLACRGVLGDPLLIARWSSLTGAVAYSLLAGGSVPTLRAVCMTGFAVLFTFRRRRIAARRLLAMALLAMLVCDPLTILSGGFWLSYGAVVVLTTLVQDSGAIDAEQEALLKQLRTRILRALTSFCLVQARLTFALAVPLALLFGQVSPVAFFANLLAVPVFSIGVLPPALLGSMLMLADAPGGKPALMLAGGVLGWLLKPLEWFCGLPGAVWYSGPLSGSSLVTIVLGACCLLLPRPLPGFWPGATLILIGLLNSDAPRPAGLRVEVLDVGQGLAVLLQTANHNLLYDTGAKWSDGDSGQSVVVPVLRARGIDELDMLLISHADSDHSGGVASIIDAVDVAQVVAPKPFAAVLPRARACRRDIQWEWDGVRFRILHPVPTAVWSENNGSCVLLVEYQGSRILLPGDIEARVERALTDARLVPSADLVIGPHHGSKTSSSDAFVQAVSATYVVFSAGYANRWHFPDPAIVERWKSANACVLSTAKSGAIEFLADAGGLRLRRAERSVFRRPWALRKADADQCAAL